MKALIDTNILIHRETKNPVIANIGTLFNWLGKLRYSTCLHPISYEEILSNKDKDAVRAFSIKMQSYELLRVPDDVDPEVGKICGVVDINRNDINDTRLLNEVFCGRVDLLLTEDKKIHLKASRLGIQKKVYTISDFLNYVKSQTPGLVDYDILEIRKKYFSELDVNDDFFDSLREDYDFDKWFAGKYSEQAYVLSNSLNKIEAFLYLKIEGEEENYWEITPAFVPKKRLKIGTLKVAHMGMRLGERFLKIIFDNAKANSVDEIYVTIFDKTVSQKALIELIGKWGFLFHGKKNNGELVYKKMFSKESNNPVDKLNPRITYPYVSQGANYYMIPIMPEFHSDLFPDSILRGENTGDFTDSSPHRNALAKSYVTSSKIRDLKSGDGIVFYRTGGLHKGVATTIGIVEGVTLNLSSAEELIATTKKRTVFTETELRDYFNKRKGWSVEYRPYVIDFLYVGTIKKRPNLEKMIEMKIVDVAPRGVVKLSRDSFRRLYDSI